jgi:hypothetical protein
MLITKELTYEPVSIKGDFRDYCENNSARLSAIDAEAKSKGQLVGRFITEPYADSCAVYQIVAESDTEVRIHSCKGLGDDWTIPYWGAKATIRKDYAQEKVELRDRRAAYFATLKR